MGNTDKDLQNNEDRRYKVYVYTNKVNGKKYVGQTNKSLIRRAHKDGSGYSSCPIFSNCSFRAFAAASCPPPVLQDNNNIFMSNLF